MNRERLIPKITLEKATASELLEHGDLKHKRSEIIDVEMIVTEMAIADNRHIQELAESMQGDRGQISPIAVRARLRGKDVYFDVIDGFHRSEGFKRIGKKTCDAVVLYGCDDEELADLRVLAANSVREVKFARMAIWMQDSFSKSPWIKKGLSLAQVLGITSNDSSGRNLGLEPKEVEEAKKWVKAKVKKWQQPLAVAYQNMRAVERSFPEIVEQVRVGGGGGVGRKGVLRPSSFLVLVDFLPNDLKNQRKAVDAIIKHSLNRAEVEIMCQMILVAKKDTKILKTVVSNPRDKKLQERLLKTKTIRVDKKETERTNQEMNNQVATDFDTIDQIQREVVAKDTESQEEEEIELPEEFEPPDWIEKEEMVVSGPSGNDKGNGLGIFEEDRRIATKTTSELLKENEQLKKELAFIHERLAEASSGNPYWYKTLPDISFEEKVYMELLYERTLAIEDMCIETGKTENRILQMLGSAHRKYAIYLQDNKSQQKMKSLRARDSV